MKKVLMAGIVLMAMTGWAKADANKVISDITKAPGKLHNHIQMEIEKTKEFQKKSWADARIQFGNLKKLFIKDQ